jgi:NitT/TauT family transport system ATP-binding protein
LLAKGTLGGTMAKPSRHTPVQTNSGQNVDTRAVSGDLVMQNIAISYRTVSGATVSALKNISLTIPNGQFVVVIGRSGCGKSTLMNVVSGLLTPTSGSISLAGKLITGPGRDRGLVFQADAVFPWKRVGKNLDFALRLGGVPASARPALIAEHLDLVRLAGTEKLFPKELSGGMRKRLAIAMVLANKPDMLLMDEPFGALDYATKVEMQLEVAALREVRPLTTMFVTHDVEEAVFLADRVIVMAAGEIVDDVMVNIPRPRDLASRKSPEFAKIAGRLLDRIMAPK